MIHRFHLTILFILLGEMTYGQSPKIGDKLPSFTLDRVINSKQNIIKAEDLRGKIAIIEFWGTWCAPCIPAMTHLDVLQKHFSNDLVVIAVSDDSKERLQKFLTKNPISIPLVSDVEHTMQSLFKYQMIPHTILIDKNQNIVAITTPDQINDSTIQSLLNGKNVNIHVKIDSEFDPEKDYFFANPDIQFSVVIKPYMQGFPSMSKIGQGNFKDRRISFINVLPSMIIRRGYNLTSEVTINEQPKELTEFVPENLICFDIIVPESKKADLDKMMISEIEKQFPIQSRFVKHKSSVYVLTRNRTYPEICVSNLPEAISFSGSGIEATGAKVDVLKSYIENILGRPVIDESGLEKHYDFIFEILQEDRDNSMKESLAKLGLKLLETERDIDFLTISSK